MNGSKMTMYQSINDGMKQILAEESNSVIIGEDIEFGGVFRCTMGLKTHFGKLL